jgi:uncharacterized protein YukE
MAKLEEQHQAMRAIIARLEDSGDAIRQIGAGVNRLEALFESGYPLHYDLFIDS